MTAEDDDLPGRGELAALGKEIFTMMVKDPQPFTVSGKRLRERNQAFVPCVYGLGIHAVQCGHAMIDLHESGREVVSLPLGRLSLEAAINALWLVQTGEGLKGFVNEAHRQRESTFAEMAKSANEVFRVGAVSREVEENYPQSFTDAAARHFQQMSSALSGGHDAYVLYRILSQYAHPGLRLVDEYLLPDEQSPVGVKLITSPEKFTQEADISFLWVTVVAMMWGARALDHLQQDHPHRARLRGVARQLQAPETLRLTQQARAEYARRAQEERRRGWKGKRARNSRGSESDA